MYVFNVTKETGNVETYEKQVICSVKLSAKVFAKWMLIAMVYIVLGVVLVPVMKNFLLEHRGRDYYINRYLDENHSISQVYGEEFNLCNNIGVIKNIRSDDCWNFLNYEERCKVMKSLALCEAQRLGIPYKVTICFSDEMQSDTDGTYAHSTKTISFNKNFVMCNDSENVIFVVLHEAYHAYQHSLVEVVRNLTPEQRGLQCFDGVEEWAENEFYYISGDTEDEIEAYYSQPLERDAAKYAYDNIAVYHAEIDKLLYAEGIE